MFSSVPGPSVDLAVDPGPEVVDVGVHARVRGSGAPVAPAHHADKRPCSISQCNQWATAVTLASVNASLVEDAGTQHGGGDLAVAVPAPAVGQADQRLAGLLQFIRAGATFGQGSPSEDG